MINNSIFSTMMGSSNKNTNKVAPKSVSAIKSRMASKSSTDNIEKKNKDEFNSYKFNIFKRMDKINDILSKNIQLKKDEQKADREVELEKKKELFFTKKIKSLSISKSTIGLGLSFLVGLLYEKILNLVKYLTDLLSKWHDQIKNIFTGIEKIYQDVVSTVSNFATSLIDSIKETYDTIYNWGVDLYNSVAKFFNMEPVAKKEIFKKPPEPVRGEQQATNTNNNPGNIMAGSFATSQGATGVASNGVATFPDQATGDAAQHELLTKNYGDLSLKDIPTRWAPKDDGKDPKLKGNDPVRYAKQLQEFTQFDDTTMAKKYHELTPPQQVTFRNAQSRVEGTSRPSTAPGSPSRVNGQQNLPAGSPGAPDDISRYGDIAGLVRGSGFVNGVPEAIAGGRASKETIEAAQMIANDTGLNFRSRGNFRFNAFDDAYHRKERGNSGHTKGKAFDIAFDGASSEDAKKITALLAGKGTATFEAAGRGGSTGDHIHVEMASSNTQVAANSESAITQVQTPTSGVPSVSGVYSRINAEGKTSAEKLSVVPVVKKPEITNINAAQNSNRENLAELPIPKSNIQLIARDPHMSVRTADLATA